MKSIIKLFQLGFISLSMFSCTDGDTAVQDSMTKIYFSVDPFQSSEISSRTSVDPSNKYTVTWASGDVVGIFPREGYQEPFSIPADQIGQSKASFDGGYWALKDGLTYNAYYPFDKANFESADCKTTIPVTYLGQSQTGTACNAGAFDYTYSDWTKASSGATSFKFHHIGSFLVLTLKIPATSTYTSLTLNANSEVIPTTGTYDLTATTPTFVAKTYASSLTMALSDFSGTAGEDATFYMMMPPCDLSTATLTATLSTGTATCSYDITSQNILAAHLYKVTGTPKSSSVDGTVDGWEVEEETNEHEYVDLGLSVKWAICNVGATNPEDYGLYFAWGETIGYTSDTSDGRLFNWASYKWIASGQSSWQYCTKYTCADGVTSASWYSNGIYVGATVDGITYTNKTALDKEDDAASVNWGGSWRMPTDAELTELRENCTWTRAIENGVKGYRVTSKKEGYTDKCIFLPGAGYRYNSMHYYNGDYIGFYWSNSLYTNSSTNAYNLYFDSSNIVTYNYERCYGQSIRPVCQ